MDQFITTLLLGIVTGSVYALAATGLVLTYKTSGILNLGFGSVAVFTAYLYWQFAVAWNWPLWMSAVIVVGLIAPAIGVFLDTQLFRRIEGQPPAIGLIATVGIFVLLQGLVRLIWEGKTQSVPSLFTHYFGAGRFELPGGAFISTDQLGVLVVAAGSAATLGAFLRYTTLGVAFRAVVDNRAVGGLMGINTGVVSGLAWAMSIAFAAMVGILLTPSTLLDPNFLPPFIIAFVLGAAVIGYLRSLPLAWLGGIGLGVAQNLFIQYGSQEPLFGTITLDKLSDALPFLMITTAVLIAPRALRAGGFGASFIVRAREQADASPRARTLGAALVFVVLALSPVMTAGSNAWRIALTISVTMAIVFLSLVVLTGYSGQISLGHTAFMGISVFTAAHIVSDLAWPMWVAFPLGVLAAAPAGALIGLIAVRLHGIFLALMTLAFAFMMQTLFFADPGISGGEGGVDVPRPPGFTSETGLFYLALIVLGGAVLLAVNLRTGRTGRILAGMRDSETACRSLGIPVLRYKVFVFALSASIAGAGALLNAMILQQANVRTYLPFFALFYVTLAVLGGIFHIGGAITVGLLFGVFPVVFAGTFLADIQLILFGLGATLALAKNPEGMFGQIRRGTNAVVGWFTRDRRAQVTPAPVAGGQR